MTRRAACTCGALSVDTEGEPLRISVCHCFACQRRSGSAFAVQARFPRTRTTITGPSTTYVRTGDAGGTCTFHFCPTCGDTVYYDIDAIPDVLAIPVGAFADSAFPPPTIGVYEGRRHPWVTVDGLAEHHD
jgi:hypothetical protein